MSDYIVRTIVKKHKNKYIYEYTDKRGKSLKKKDVTPYLDGFYLPPAYEDVQIYKNKNGKIFAKGKDVKGRSQYIYNPKFTKKSAIQKYKQLIEFGKNYHPIMKQIQKDMFSFQDSKTKQIAMILKIMNDCNFRVGNERYTKENKSFGICTIQNEHVKIKGDQVIIDFSGKKGVQNTCKVKDKKLSKNLKTRKKTLKKKDRVFTYRVNNRYHNVTAQDVNHYLKKFGKITAKNFRTWSANITLIGLLVKHEDDDLQKALKECVQIVADKMHHSSSICKKNYLNPELMKMFLEQNDDFHDHFKDTSNDKICNAFISFLKTTYS